MRSPNQRRSWFIPALIALVLFVGGLAANLVTSDMSQFVAHYRPWLVGVVILAGVVAVAVAIRDVRRPTDDKPGTLVAAADAYAQLRRDYLERIAEQFRYLPLSSLDAKSASAETSAKERQQMADVYI